MTDPKFSPENVLKIAGMLIGQCQVSMDQAIEEVTGEELVTCPHEFLLSIDERVFCCDGCGWYCSADELNNDSDEQLCEDCANG